MQNDCSSEPKMGKKPRKLAGKIVSESEFRTVAAAWHRANLTRLSSNYILRDFTYSTEAGLMGLANQPEDLEMVIRAGQAICEKVLEPITDQFGRPAITYGYACREAIEAGYEVKNPKSSAPHQWDRKSFGDEVYARVDILPFCVEDGLISKHDFGHWVMYNLDIDLLQQWSQSNVFCITVSPKPR